MWFGTDNNTGYMTEIVGVVGDVRSLRLDRKNDVEFYRPWAQRSNAFMAVTVRTAMKTEAAAGMVDALIVADVSRMASLIIMAQLQVLQGAATTLMRSLN